MSYSIQEQYSRDIDYYIFNLELGLLHFASAGGRLPKIIESNDLINEELNQNIQQLPAELPHEVNPNLSEILGLNIDQLESYIVDFVNMAKKGLISYDKTYINNSEDQTYHLVAWPTNQNKTPFWFPFEFPFEKLNINNLILNKSKIPFNSNAKANMPFKLNLE
jgi:hypothetical protein